MPDVIPPEFQSLLRYDRQWQVLVCRVHRAAVPFKSLFKHLRVEHDIYFREIKSLRAALSDVPCCQVREDLPHPNDNQSPIKDLEILKGYGCPHCEDKEGPNGMDKGGDKQALSQNESLVRKHISLRHGDLPHSVRNTELKPVLLQSWGKGLGGGYWTVRAETALIIGSNMESAGTACTWEEALVQREREHRQSRERQLLEFHASNKKDDTTPWLLFTKWSELFEGRDIRLIAETRFLNSSDREILEMSPISKPRLQVLSQCFDRILMWGLETLESTDWHICRWLRSPNRAECNPVPFRRPQNPGTLSRYSGYWKQLLYFSLRTALIDDEVRERIYGVEFTEQQMRLAQELSGPFLEATYKLTQ